MLKDYFILGRPINALAGCTAVFISAYAAGALTWWPIVLAALSVLLITVSTNAWNDYIDIEIDRINKPQRPLPAGRISPRSALLFSIIGSALSLGVAAFINQPAFWIACGANALLYLYSWRLKCTVLLGNTAVATIIALCFIYGGVAAGNIRPTLMLALTVFITMIGREILKTMADYRGDLKENCRTIATAWGKSIAAIFVTIFLGLSAALMVVTYFVENYSPFYLLPIVSIMFPLFGFVAVRAHGNVTGETLERYSTWIKYSFFVWFLAVTLGIALAG